jgi:hypothetical protein
MESITTFKMKYDIYGETNLKAINLNNKLFCTFTQENLIEDIISDLSYKYTILYNKIFVLEVKDNNEYVITYNIDLTNLANIPLNTILVHRKKESNTLYTINALNELIKKLNGGVVDPKFKIDWLNYKNTILLTQQNELKLLRTKIHKIIEL